VRSPYGHDAFLKETDKMDSILASALGAPEKARTKTSTFDVKQSV
jgi:hypothetical protein